MFGDETVLYDLADVFSFRVFYILVPLVIFELQVTVFGNFADHAGVWHY